MKDFLKYFLGKGETEEFANFTLPHFLPILLAIGLIYLIYRYRQNIRGLKNEHYFRRLSQFHPKARTKIALIRKISIFLHLNIKTAIDKMKYLL